MSQSLLFAFLVFVSVMAVWITMFQGKTAMAA